MLHEADQALTDVALRDVDAEQLRNLIDDDHDRDAGLEAGQHRRRDEVGEEPEPQGAAASSEITPTVSASEDDHPAEPVRRPPRRRVGHRPATRIAIVDVVVTLNVSELPVTA